jgi:predicted RNA-binding Zn ribbon-like protein
MLNGGRWMMTENDTAPFVFRGETLALDLVNTVKAVRGRTQDLLEAPEALARWWEFAQQHYALSDVAGNSAPMIGDSTLESVVWLREVLRRLFTGIIDGSSPDQVEIAALNSVLALGHPALEWAEHDAAHTVYAHDGTPRSSLLLPVALSALDMLTTGDLSRLHRCQNQRCILHFYDTTKSGTRRFCSTACLDRVRSAQRYEEQKRG